MRGPARSGGQAPVRRERAWMTAYCHSDHSLCRVDGERCRVTLSRLRASQLTVSVRQSKMSCASRFQPFISRGRRVRGRANESPCEAAIGSHGDLAPVSVLINRPSSAESRTHLPYCYYCLTPALHPRARSHHRALLGIASLSCQQRSARQPQDHAQDTDLDRQCKRYFNLQLARGAGARLDGDFLRPGL